MEIVTIHRAASDDQGILGALNTNGFSCKVIELPWRDNKSNRSCIPVGEYLCKPHPSRKFGKVYHVTGVDGRSWILTHAGNVAGDVTMGFASHSWGCILLGRRHGQLLIHGKYQKAVLCSRPTVRAFVRHMRWQPFKLRIETLPKNLSQKEAD